MNTKTREFLEELRELLVKHKVDMDIAGNVNIYVGGQHVRYEAFIGCINGEAIKKRIK